MTEMVGNNQVRNCPFFLVVGRGAGGEREIKGEGRVGLFSFDICRKPRTSTEVNNRF
jgi:hypothetical protein